MRLRERVDRLQHFNRKPLFIEDAVAVQLKRVLGASDSGSGQGHLIPGRFNLVVGLNDIRRHNSLGTLVFKPCLLLPGLLPP